jgi:hypothetical protein
MPGNRDQLTEELSERLRRLAEKGEVAAVLDAAVPGMLRDLAGTFILNTRYAVTPEVATALKVLVAVHWLRSQLLPAGQDYDDLQACLSWSAVLLPLAPELVPEPVRAHLSRS